MPSESDRSAPPAAPPPQGDYRPAIVDAGLVMTAGMTPRVDGVLQHAGRVGADIDLETARSAAAVAAGNAYAAAVSALGSADAIRRALRLTVFVNAASGFTQHSAVADGASARLRELLGERGAVVRSAVGVASLPGGACVEVELTCSVD